MACRQCALVFLGLTNGSPASSGMIFEVLALGQKKTKTINLQFCGGNLSDSVSK